MIETYYFYEMLEKYFKNIKKAFELTTEEEKIISTEELNLESPSRTIRNYAQKKIDYTERKAFRRGIRAIFGL